MPDVAPVVQRPIGRNVARKVVCVPEGEETMSTCRICGNEVREGEDVVRVGEDAVHPDCAGAPKKRRGRKIGMWASLGSRGQMAMGDVQREP